MFLLPPPEGLDALNQQLRDAYSSVTTSANSLFDAIGLTPLLEATRMDPATQLAVGSAIGVPPTPRLGMLSRYRALRESPLWSTMPREQQLQALRGQPTISPDLRGALSKAGGYRAAENKMAEVLGRDPRSSGSALLQDWNRSNLGYLRDLLQGGRKP